MFAPPSAGDAANYALAQERKQRSSIIAQLAADPQYAGFDHQAILADLYDPTASFRKLEIDDATTRRGQDVSAATSIANNSADNRRQIVTSAFQPLSQGQVRPDIPASVLERYDMPALPAVAGAPKPLSNDEWEAIQRETLLKQGVLGQDDVVSLIMGDVPVENVVGSDGKPVVVPRVQAVGQQPYFNPTASTQINLGPNGESYGSPGEGLVWARNPDGTVGLDERGAPVAIPYKGGKAWRQQEIDDAAAAAAEAAAAGKADNIDTKSGIIVQDIDRILNQVSGNEWLTTGVGSQATSWIGGTPAQGVSSLLDTIKANTGFDQLQALRDASPTGGALGPVSDKENNLLQSVLGSVDPAQPAGQLADNLKRIKNIYLDIIHGPNMGPPRERLSFPSQWDPAAPIAGAKLPPPKVNDVVDGYRYRGGDPANPASWEPAVGS